MTLLHTRDLPSTSPPTPASSRRPVAPAVAPGTLAALVLVSVTAVWGSTFPLFKSVLSGPSGLPAADFLATRFALAALAATLLAPRAIGRLTARERGSAGVLGVLYALGQVTSTIGLEETPASVSGFVTGLYVVLTPVLGVLLLRRRVAAPVWVAVALATAGLAVLALRGFGLGPGVAITLASAVLYAGHVLATGQWARSRTALGSTIVQLWVAAAVSLAFALPGGVTTPHATGGWLVMAYAALVSGALGLIAQTWAQAQISAERAAIMMTLEPCWAAAFAVVVGGEPLSGRLLVGGGLVLAGMAIAETSGRLRLVRRPARDRHEGLPSAAAAHGATEEDRAAIAADTRCGDTGRGVPTC